MSDTGQGEGWWQASDGKWYPPQQHPDYQAEATQPVPAAEPPATAAMPPVPPVPPGVPPGAIPPPGAASGPVGPPPGAPGAASSNAKWIVVGVLAVAAIAIAAFLLTRDDGKKSGNLAATPSASPSSSSSTSSSSSSSSSSTSSSSKSSSSSSSSSGDSASALQARLLKASDIGSDFTDESFTPDTTSPGPCGQPNVSSQYPPVVDVGSEASNGSGDLFFQQEVTTYNDAATGSKAYEATKESVNCSQSTVGSGSDAESNSFSKPTDVSSKFGVPEAVEVTFESGSVQGQIVIIHSGNSMVLFVFAGTTNADTSNVTGPDDLVRKGLAKLSS